MLAIVRGNDDLCLHSVACSLLVFREPAAAEAKANVSQVTSSRLDFTVTAPYSRKECDQQGIYFSSALPGSFGTKSLNWASV